MAAIIKRRLRLRPNAYARPHPFPLHHYSSSSDPDPLSDIPQPEPFREPDSATQTQSSVSSYFNEVKASLQKEPPQQNRHQTPRKPFSFSNRSPPQTTPPSRTASIEEIRRNLSEFRLRSAAPPPSSSTISLQELYKRNVISKADDTSTSDSPTETPSVGLAAGGKLSVEAIRANLRQLKPTTPAAINRGKPSDPFSLARFRESLKLKPDPNANLDSTMIIGGSDSFPPTLFGKETRGKGDDNVGSIGVIRSEFVRMYDHLDLGKKLKMLRPEKRKGKWFSLQELNERLAKLREIEEKESEAKLGVPVKDLRESLMKWNIPKDEKARQGMKRRLDVLGYLGGTPSFMLSPPKEHLVEKYFHPDNMSSAEKLKLELKRVRDEFKMSESDCGSARVQVAQLTTKIKHLSTVLQKKDKHSRRGLQAMVQRRKKLLKYIRRTDWDSYCLVLSKLGLRDNPDIKA
ncbi:hypothetical protein Pfo_020108 [Paulownia fortunei]|nr:hypothetical protein Pfo_020108 [Paulownia fortunei]